MVVDIEASAMLLVKVSQLSEVQLRTCSAYRGDRGQYIMDCFDSILRVVHLTSILWSARTWTASLDHLLRPSGNLARDSLSFPLERVHTRRVHHPRRPVMMQRAVDGVLPITAMLILILNSSSLHLRPRLPLNLNYPSLASLALTRRIMHRHLRPAVQAGKM